MEILVFIGIIIGVGLIVWGITALVMFLLSIPTLLAFFYIVIGVIVLLVVGAILSYALS